MKNILLYGVAFLLMFTACQKKTDNSIGGQSVDERLTIAMAAYQKKLTDAPYGWVMMETTNGKAVNQGAITDGPVAVFNYYMKFNESNQVTMYSDFDTTTAGIPKVSSYRVKALQRPALIFDTYSYIHIPSDPDPSISKSPFGAGLGWGTDFEFSFSDNVAATQLGDTIHLTGNLNSASAVLVKATKDQQDAYNAAQLKTTRKLPYYILNYFKQLTLGSKTYEVFLSESDHTITINYLDASGNLKSFTTTYSFNANGIVFLMPFVDGATTLNGLNIVAFNSATGIVTVSSGGITGQLTGVNQPLKADLAAPQRWWTEAYNLGTYWYTFNGFHVNGVDDAFGVRAIVSGTSVFYYYLYWPGYYSNPVDIFCPALLTTANSLGLATAYTIPSVPTFTVDGKGIFKRFSSVGTTVAGSAQDKSNVQLYNTAGYYFVQKGAKAYDMVLASDSKVWLSWVRN